MANESDTRSADEGGKSNTDDNKGQVTDVKWQDHIPVEYKEEKLWEPLNDKSLGDVLKGYAEAQKLQGRSITLPANDKPEEWDRLWAKLGRPETADKYDIKPPENLPKNVQWNEEAVKKFREVAFREGVTGKQAAALITLHNEIIGNMTAQVLSEADGLTQLKTAYGEKKAAEIVTNSQRAVKELADESFSSFLDETGMGNHPAVLGFLAKVGEMIEEELPPKGEGSSEMTQAEALIEIAKIRGNPIHPFHKGNKTAVEEMSRLYEVGHPGGTVLEIG